MHPDAFFREVALYLQELPAVVGIGGGSGGFCRELVGVAKFAGEEFGV